MSAPDEAEVVRFWAKVDRSGGPDDCWPWFGSTARHGYGQLSVNGKNRRAAKIAWSVQNNRPFPEERLACHTCDNPSCVNPSHIWPGTQKQNMQDALSKGRLAHQRQTHCKHGHEFTLENTRMRIIGKDAVRVCLTCKRAHHKIYSDKRRTLRNKARMAKDTINVQ